MFISTGRTPLSVALVAVLASGTVAAQGVQEDNIEEVIVSGSLSRYSALKSDTPIMETARSVSIETLEQMLDDAG